MQAVLLRSDFLVRRSALPVRTSALSGCASRSSILSLQLHAGEVRCVVLRLFGSCESHTARRVQLPLSLVTATQACVFSSASSDKFHNPFLLQLL